MKIFKYLSLLLIKLYQKISKFTPNSCRYYPSCSDYAKMEFENNNFFKASINSTLRILRCNQLFDGGFDYPIVKKSFHFNPLQKREFKKLEIKYWFIPKNTNTFYVVKKIKFATIIKNNYR